MISPGIRRKGETNVEKKYCHSVPKVGMCHILISGGKRRKKVTMWACSEF